MVSLHEYKTDAFTRVALVPYMAISTVVSIAEILKNNGLATEKKIMTSTVDVKEDMRGRPVQKANIEIVLGKTVNFDELMITEQNDGNNLQEQN
ncbi:hypothetical protein RND71_006131 [Anisodus tanguticus]|uniref:Alba DNA/RNA-binding protein n=1 Tax=Anisodus tanguticus TaxID=243964 RepID=A0AAE1ST73_9SOLA|nr:hypothetical protein RND71_006131 [Anisodus tanguticus]